MLGEPGKNARNKIACSAPLMHVTTSFISGGHFSFLAPLLRALGVLGENQLLTSKSSATLMSALAVSQLRNCGP